MATLVLQAAGQALGGSLFGGVGGILGSAVGAVAGYAADNALFGDKSAPASVPPLSDLSVQSSNEGASIPRVFGRVRIAGQVIWATEYEEVVEEDESGGGKGGGGTSTKTYSYYGNFAVGLCEGRISRIGRVWADGNPLDLTQYDFRIHKGSANADPDAFIESFAGNGQTPAYNDTAYVVFERMPLATFGNRIPNLTFEVIRVIDRLENQMTAITLIPASTEFGYFDESVTRSVRRGEVVPENRHTGIADTDWTASLDELMDLCPNLESVALVVAWFGTDLRCDHCDLKPGVEQLSRDTDGATWRVGDLERGQAHLVSRHEGRPAYGGTPSDETVVAAIRDLKDRGLRVVLYPFIMMDIEQQNDLPDPYGSARQAPYPWRGRITCNPAPGQGGSPDKSAAAASQVAGFVGMAQASDFSVNGTELSYSGPNEWSYRRMILHYAHLCEAAGGVHTFLIGAEMRGMTHIRSSNSAYPFVNALVGLAADVKTVLRSSTSVTYGADWSEYFGHHPQDGSNDVYFHLDPLWASNAIDMVGIDNYMPLADWRDGDHEDVGDTCSIYDLDYLRANIAGGEGYDWHYPSLTARRSGNRSDITDGAHGKPWVFRYKDLISWWSKKHYDRPGGAESATSTDWSPESKPIWFTELGCPAIDRGANQPNVFYDPKSSESFFPYFSNGRRDDFMQRRFLQAVLSFWDPNDPDYVAGSNPVSSKYGGRMISRDNIHVWTWDARPFPAFPSLIDTWSDGGNWFLGHWLTGRLGGVTLAKLIEDVLKAYGVDEFDIEGVDGVIDGYVIRDPVSARDILEPLANTFRFVAVDTGRTLRFAGLNCKATAAITDGDIAVTDDLAPRISITRGQETELPQEVRINYFDSTRDAETAAGIARRTAGQSARVTASSLPVVAAPSLMRETAETMLHDLWAGRERFDFSIDPKLIGVEPGDLIALDTGDITRSVLVERIEDAGLRKIEARAIDPTVFRPTPSPADRRRGRRPQVFGKPLVSFLDLPVLDPDDPHQNPYIAVYSKPWPGSLALWRSTSSQSYKRIATLDRRARMGETLTGLGPGPVGRWDRVNKLRIELFNGTLASRDEGDVLAGANTLAVFCQNGAWEILQYATAELVGEKTYEIRDLLRAQLGTEDAMNAGIAIDAICVFVNGAVTQFPVQGNEIGNERLYRIGPSGRNIAERSYVEIPFAAGARGLRPLSPVHLRARRDQATGDVILSWIRRSRIDGDNWDALDVPLGEAFERYRVDIRDGGDTVRTLETDHPSATYTSSQQIADFGALQSNYDIRVAQVAETVLGIPREGNLHV